MSFRADTLEITLGGGLRWAFDLFELTKPRLVLMVLITTCVGYYLGSGEVWAYFPLVHTLIGTALAAGGTLALNEFVERETDACMERTRHRPLPEGRVQPLEALIFGIVCTIAGLMLLVVASNLLSALITALIVVSYLFVYTPLKQKTPLCGLVGAIPGALPPMIGWAAARGDLGVEAWILFGMLFCWQIPHTLAIGRLYREDFARAKIQFLPVVDPDGKRTGRQVVGHTLALLVVSLLPVFFGLAGWLYGAVAVLLGVAFLACGISLAICQNLATARRLLFASLIYLPVILLVMAIDRVLI
jgi:protoheme IX farnesyltransferase